jgi:D-alanyl-D-alanine carboxypeptidase
VAFVDPNAPLHPKWYYSNTGYILTEMIVQKASGRSYAAEVASVIEQAGLHQTFYAPSFYPPAIQERIVHGYYFNHDPGNQGLAPLLGKDVRSFSISWTQAAGGIAGTPHDLVSWARQLYTGPLLTAPERASMETLVSTKTGAPIPHLTKDDPRGFGLGVSQVMREPLGTFWFYEGETLGYRVAHIYIPKSNVVIVVALNSQASPSVDGIGPLLETIYKTLETHGMLH